MNQTSQELIAAQQRLAQAQADEQQRQQAATTPQQVIAAEQKRITQLQAQQRQEHFSEAARQVEQAAQLVSAANKTVIAALERGDVRAAESQRVTAKATWDRYDALWNQTMSIINDDIQEAQNPARFVASYGLGAGADQQARMAGREVDARYRRQLAVAPAIDYDLAEWVAQARDPKTAWYRMGLCFALIGPPLWVLPADYNARLKYESDQQARQFHTLG